MNNFQNLEAEITLIGSIMLRNNIMAEADILLEPEDFAIKANGEIFKTMLAMYKKGIGIDQITVASQMDPETLKAIGGKAYLYKATQTPATTLNYRDHINEIKRKSKARKLHLALHEGLELVHGSDPDQVIEHLQSRILETQREQHIGLSQVPDIALEIIEGEPESKIMTGYKSFDHVMKGLRKGRVLTIAGRPGTGKTAFALRILDQLPETERAIYFSLEMGKSEITQRLMAAQTYIKLDKIINKTFNEMEKAKLIECKSMKSYNIPIDDSPGMTIQRIRAKARVEKIKHGLSVIFIDHIGLLNPSMKGMKAYERMTEISKGMKELAKELDITVIALSQLNRAPADRKEGEPILSELRDSGSIEQDSDQVVLIYNPNYQEESSKNAIAAQGAEILIAKIAKNRSGGIGKIAFDYYKDTQVIEEQYYS